MQANLRTQLLYGFPALALTAAGVSVYVFITRFYADCIGISLSVIGAVVLGSRIWDAVIDPSIGALADRTSSRLGRRRAWLLFSLIPFSFALFALFAPPAELSARANEIWFAVSTFLFFLFLSTVQIPYEALGAELSNDYNQRNRLFAIRQGFFILGTVFAAALPSLLIAVWGFPEQVTEQRGLFAAIGFIYAVLTVLSVLFLTNNIAGSEKPTIREQIHRSLMAQTLEALQSPAFRILIIAYVLSGFGAALPATLIEFYVRYVLGGDSSAPFLVLYFSVGFVTLPIWVWLANRYDKRNTWMVSLVINAGAFLGVFFLGPGSQSLYALLVTISGIGFGGVVTIPLSMQADVIEHDARRNNGLRREGTFMGLWSVASKLSAALGAGIAFPLLDFVGYVPNQPQSESVILTLRALYAGLPALCYLLSLFVIIKFPLSRQDFN
jgi:GPH family glycoside/pentoside/hexuronide:cation symporter